MQELGAAHGAAKAAVGHARKELEGKQAAAEQAAQEAAALRRALAEARGAADELRMQLERRSAEAQDHEQVRRVAAAAHRARAQVWLDDAGRPASLQLE